MKYDPDFDGQRLAFHPVAVAEWLTKGITRGPLYTELELTTVCPCHCSFCGVEHIVNRRRDFLDKELAKRVLSELAEVGNKAVLISGHGEPLMHPEAAPIIAHASSLMSTAVTTNGILLDQHDPAFMDRLKWLRFSVNGCDPSNYATIHRSDERAFERVISNIASAVKRKKEKGLLCVIGVQLVLLDENVAGVMALARQVKKLGVDYFTVKPYSQHPLSKHRERPDYSQIDEIERQLRSLEDEGFRVHFRRGSFERLSKSKRYGTCYGTHFLAYISANGMLWECNVFADDPRFLVGDLKTASFSSLWTSVRRMEILKFIRESLDLSQCRDVCRMDSCNHYLWRLLNPLAHDDFI